MPVIPLVRSTTFRAINVTQFSIGATVVLTHSRRRAYFWLQDRRASGQFSREDDNLMFDPDATDYPVAVILDDPTGSGRGKVMGLHQEN